MKIVIPIPEKVSLNAIYAGIHFRQRASHKEAYQCAVMCARPQPYSGPFPVHCHYHFRLTGNRLDVSNHAYMLKMTEDALVACGVFPDDTPEFISGVSVTAEHVKKGAGDDEVVVSIEVASGPRTS